jgi:hypothetical protein
METTHLPLMQHRSCNDDSLDTLNLVIGGLVSPLASINTGRTDLRKTKLARRVDERWLQL